MSRNTSKNRTIFELRAALASRGFEVAIRTVSADLAELGVEVGVTALASRGFEVTRETVLEDLLELGIELGYRGARGTR